MTARPDQPWRRFAVARDPFATRVYVGGTDVTHAIDTALTPATAHRAYTVVADAPLPNRRDRRAGKRPNR